MEVGGHRLRCVRWVWRWVDVGVGWGGVVVTKAKTKSKMTQMIELEWLYDVHMYPQWT